MTARAALVHRPTGSMSIPAAAEPLGALLFAAAAVLAAALLAQYISMMATTSLWMDELYTVLNFSAKGAWTAWTDYHVPNNHILYNVLNSGWPVAIAHEPVPARLLSFLAMGAVFVLLALLAVEARAWGGGALAMLLLATNTETLDLTLQARGYGLATLACLVQVTAAGRYLRQDHRGWLALTVAAAFVGGAALPVYILFAVPFCLGLLILRPRRDVAIAIGAAALLGAAFYAPTVRQIIAASSAYAEIWGTEYVSLDAVGGTFSYILPAGLGSIAYAVLVAWAIGYGVLHADRPQRQFVALGVASVVLFVGLCLAMTTPLVRTTQFAAIVPLVLLVAVTGRRSIRPDTPRAIANGLLLAAAIPLCIIAADHLRDLRFKPIEAWREAAHAVDLAAPAEAPVFVTLRGHLLALYLRDPARVVDAFDAERFRRGALVVVDSDFRAKDRFSGTDHAPGAVDAIVPQVRGRRQIVSFVPPASEAFAVTVTGARADGLERLHDGDSRTGWVARRTKSGRPVVLDVAPEGTCARLLVLAGRGMLPDGIAVGVERNGALQALDGDRVGRAGSLLVVDIGEPTARRVEIQFAPHASGRPLALDEVWCLPAVEG